MNFRVNGVGAMYYRDWWCVPKDKKLRNKRISMVKVLLEHHRVQDATWETEDWMKKKYP
jgi:hypothetical protein